MHTKNSIYVLISKATKRTHLPNHNYICHKYFQTDYLNTDQAQHCVLWQKSTICLSTPTPIQGFKKNDTLHIYDNANFLKVSANKFTGRYKLFCITISSIGKGSLTLIVNFGYCHCERPHCYAQMHAPSSCTYIQL